MASKEQSIEAFIESALREAFDKVEADTRAAFESSLPAKIAARRAIVERVAKSGVAPKASKASNSTKEPLTMEEYKEGLAEKKKGPDALKAWLAAKGRSKLRKPGTFASQKK